MSVHQTTVRVRYAEVDRMGVLHHSRYFVYMEIARTEALRAAGLTYREIEDSGRFLVVMKASCRYHAPARYDDELVIETRIARATSTRIDHTYTITRKTDSVTVAEGETTLACVDGEGAVSRIPSEILERLDPSASSQDE